MADSKKASFHEVNASLLWFLMDGLWMMGFKILPAIVSIPAVICGCLVLVYADKTPRLLAVTIAGSSWMFMDISWLIDEHFGIPGLKIFSHSMFWLTFICLAYSMTASKEYRESVYEALSRFNRIKKKNPAT